MKKNIQHIVYCLLFTVYYLPASAQSRCQKGTWVFGLNPVSYSFFNNGKSTLYTSDTIVNVSTSKSNGISIGYNIGAGYFVRDNFCIGSGFGNSAPGILSAPRLSTDLFARYYLMQQKRCFSFTKQDNTRRFAFFIQAVIIGGYFTHNDDVNSFSPTINYTSVSKSKGTTYVYGGQAAIGYTYMLAKHIAFELLSIYGNSTFTLVDTGSRDGIISPPSKSVSHNNALSLLFGIQTYF